MHSQYIITTFLFLTLASTLSPICLILLVTAMFDIHSLTPFGKNKISPIPCTYIDTKSTLTTTQKKAELSHLPKLKSFKNKVKKKKKT